MEELCPPRDVKDLLPGNLLLEPGGAGCSQAAPPEQVGRQDGLVEQGGAQEARQGFDFGKLRHFSEEVSRRGEDGNALLEEIINDGEVDAADWDGDDQL